MALRFPISPMLATLSQRVPTGDGWAFEIKWDGYRNLIYIDTGGVDSGGVDSGGVDSGGGRDAGPDTAERERVRVQSRSGRDVTAQFGPELASIADHINARSAILDGEVIALDESGRPDFGALQRRDRPIAFYAFDVLQIDGTDTIALPYTDRRRLLDQLLEPGPAHLVPGYQVGGGAELVAVTEADGLEGIVAKRLDSTYAIGARSNQWRKVKHRRQTEVTIGGYTTGDGARRGHFGALLVGIAQPDGGLRFAGGVGTGFTDSALAQLTETLGELAIDRCPFDPPPPPKYTRAAHWVAPTLRATVEMSEFSNDGLIRHGSFIELLPPTPPSPD